MRTNPCRYCVLSHEYKGRHYPKYHGECLNCENRKKHDLYLENKRMYIPGGVITSLAELDECTYVFWHTKLLHIEVVRSWQYRGILRGLKYGSFRKAVKRENT